MELWRTRLKQVGAEGAKRAVANLSGKRTKVFLLSLKVPSFLYGTLIFSGGFIWIYFSKNWQR